MSAMKNGRPMQDVGRRAAHRRQALDLAGELLPLPDRVGDHVDQPGERAADLALDRDGGDDEVEVLRADARGHLLEGLVHRAAEACLGEHALELLARRLAALVDDALQALLEAVAGLQRGGERDQQVGQLVLEGRDAAGCP